ncbi:MAG: hypothetical protein ACI8V8_000173 [Chitinophagales bacterium]|jgi:hypothetical protein
MSGKLFQKLILVIFIGILSANSHAQKTQISSGVKLNSKVSNFRVLGKLDNKFIVERYGNNIHILDVYNSSMKNQMSKQINLDKNEFIEHIWMQANAAWIIRVKNDKTQNYILASKMDARLALSQKFQVLDSIVERKDLLQSNLRTTLSLNESKILVYAPIFSQGKIDYFYTKVYDINMRLINQKKIKEPTILNHEFEEVILLNDGSYLFITKQAGNTHQEVYFFNYFGTDGSIKKSQYVPVKNVFKKLEFTVDNEHNALLIAGFFSQKNESRKDKFGATEFFTTKLSLDDFSNMYTAIVPFTNEFYLNLTSKESVNYPPQLFTFYIHSIIPQIDGGAIVFTESYFKTEESSLNDSYFSISGVSNYNYSTIYNFNDIVVYHIDSTGLCFEQQIIRKKQISRNDGGSFSSFYTFNSQDKLQMLFLDEIDRYSHLTAAPVVNESTTESKSILNIGNKNVFPIMKMSKQSAPNELLIPSYNRSKMQLIKMTF